MGLLRRRKTDGPDDPPVLRIVDWDEVEQVLVEHPEADANEVVWRLERGMTPVKIEHYQRSR